MADESLVHRSALAEPKFKRYFPASCCATLGSWLVRFLFGWSAWEITHSAFWVGMVAGAMLLPTIFLSPLFGIVSDRINPRNGLLATIFAHAAIAVLAGIAGLLGLFSLPSLIGLALMLGVATSAHTPFRLALVPRLVRRQALPSAIGLSAMIFNTSRIVGPALGAWLLATTSLTAALFMSALFFLCALPVLLGIRGLAERAPRESAAFFGELRAGVMYTISHRAIRLVLVLTLINGLLGRTVLELLPAISGHLLNGTPQSLAVLSALAGVGSILGGLVVSRQGGGEARLFSLATLSLLVGTGCLFSVQWLAGLGQFGMMILLLSMITTIVGASSQALAQLMVDEAYRGRVLSLWTVLAMGAPALGAMVVGALAEPLGFPLVLAGSAVFTLVLLGLPGVRQRFRVWPN